MTVEVAAPQASKNGLSSVDSSRARTLSTQSNSLGRSAQGGGYVADNDEGEEGDYDGDDGDDDEDEQGMMDHMVGGKDMLDETTLKSGYLSKRGEKRKNWKKRWFVLRSSKLCYYKNDKEYQLLRYIDMGDVHTVAAIAVKKNENSFGIVTSKRQYYVRAANQKEMQSWIDALQDAREQIRQRRTMTQEMAAMEMNASSGGENPSTSRNTSTSPIIVPADRQQTGRGGSNSTPINIIIPGKGLYTSPAQARQNSTGTGVASPLTTTSDSEPGTGVEQFGLSYTSSIGQAMGSSPKRTSGLLLHGHDQQTTSGTSSGRHSPHGHYSGDDGIDGLPRSTTKKRSATGMRDASHGSSGGEGSMGRKASAAAGSKRQDQMLLSSSDEDGEGEDWDEDEIADRAMPLPGTSGLASPHANKQHNNLQSHSPSRQQAQNTDTNSQARPRGESDFFKDPNKVIHQGYLMKQSNRRKHWRKRWFVLTSAHLAYTRSHMTGKPHRQIPLTSILDAIEYVSKKPQPPPPSSPGLQSPSSHAQSSVDSAMATSGGGNAERSVALSPAGHAGAGGDAGPDRKGSTIMSAGMSAQPQPPKKKKENCFKIITPKRTYVVCAPTEEEEMKWLSALQTLVAYGRGDLKASEHEGSSAAASQSANAPAHAKSQHQQQDSQPS